MLTNMYTYDTLLLDFCVAAIIISNIIWAYLRWTDRNRIKILEDATYNNVTGKMNELFAFVFQNYELENTRDTDFHKYMRESKDRLIDLIKVAYNQPASFLHKQKTLSTVGSVTIPFELSLNAEFVAEIQNINRISREQFIAEMLHVPKRKQRYKKWLVDTTLFIAGESFRLKYNAYLKHYKSNKQK